MKKYLVLFLPTLFLYSCANYNLSKTVWYNLSLVEKDGQQADLTTSLYFVSDNQVDIITSVVSDSSIIVKPFKYAEGKYSVSGNPKKEAKIKIDLTTVNNKQLNLTGIYHKYDGMVLTTQDSIIKIYTKLPKIKLK